jgi:hypothetical protein
LITRMGKEKGKKGDECHAERNNKKRQRNKAKE